MISTIQLSKKTKDILAVYRNSPRESYEDAIINLICEIEQSKNSQEELLKEGCIEMAEENLKINKEWKHLDKEVESNWVW